MELFSRPKTAKKPKWLQDIEVEQQKRIRSSLQALRTTMPSKSSVNIMLHGGSNSSSLSSLANPGGWSYGRK